MSDLHALASDPTTSPEVLARLAAQHPQLQAQIALNPASQPSLVQWIAQYGTPEGRQAAARLLQPQPSAGTPHPSLGGVVEAGTPPSSPQAPPSPKGRTALWIVLALILGAVVIVVVGLITKDDAPEPVVNERAEALEELAASIESAEFTFLAARVSLLELRPYADADPKAAELVELAEETLDEFTFRFESAQIDLTLTPEGGGDEQAEITGLHVAANSLDEVEVELRYVTEDMDRMIADLRGPLSSKSGGDDEE